MEIIRDEECAGILMIPLFAEWRVKRCNFVDCKEKPNTIIKNGHPKAPVFGLCEKHYQLGNKPGGGTMRLEFDNYAKEGG